MARERLLITVKTYPTLSRKHGETVCTAGVRADGTWVRLYPVPFRRLDEAEQYRKFDWIELDVRKSTSDHRPEACERNWDEAKVEAMRDLSSHGELFVDEQWRQTFALMPKLPFNFSYQFEDSDGKRSKLQVLDWEVGQLFHNCLRDAGGDEGVALAKVKQKYLGAFLKTDLHFFLGTMKEFHGFSPNPWVIIGVLPMPHPPAEDQLELL